MENEVEILPPFDQGNRWLFSDHPIDVTTAVHNVSGRAVYVLTFRQGGMTFSIPFTDPRLLAGFGQKLIDDSNLIARPSGLYIPTNGIK